MQKIYSFEFDGSKWLPISECDKIDNVRDLFGFIEENSSAIKSLTTKTLNITLNLIDRGKVIKTIIPYEVTEEMLSSKVRDYCFDVKTLCELMDVEEIPYKDFDYSDYN